MEYLMFCVLLLILLELNRLARFAAGAHKVEVEQRNVLIGLLRGEKAASSAGESGNLTREWSD